VGLVIASCFVQASLPTCGTAGVAIGATMGTIEAPPSHTELGIVPGIELVIGIELGIEPANAVGIEPIIGPGMLRPGRAPATGWQRS